VRDVLPVDDPPERLHPLGLHVEVLQVIGVLPHVEHEQRYGAVPDVPLVVVNLLDHQALAERLPAERAPTRSLYVECGLGELASHAGDGAEELVDRPPELATRLAAAVRPGSIGAAKPPCASVGPNVAPTRKPARLQPAHRRPGCVT